MTRLLLALLLALVPAAASAQGRTIGAYSFGGGALRVDTDGARVTLFAEDPVDLKECVYRMRFDEGSAVYADFGPFITGLIGLPEEVLDRVGLR